MIEVKNLKSGYGNLENATLQIDSALFKNGRITGIIGVNSSGKTTLLKTLVGMLPFTGEILLDGKNLKAYSDKKRSQEVSYLPQKFPDVNMSVLTLVSHGRFPCLGFSKILTEQDKSLVENALSLTDLSEKRHKNFMELSGGEKQRAYLAMVIAQNAKMILLDEVTTYMDVEHQLEVFKILKSLCEIGHGIVISSHDIPQCFSFCDDVLVLKDGKIVAFGESEKIALESDILKKNLGVKLGKSNEKNSLYKYFLCDT